MGWRLEAIASRLEAIASRSEAIDFDRFFEEQMPSKSLGQTANLPIGIRFQRCRACRTVIEAYPKERSISGGNTSASFT